MFPCGHAVFSILDRKDASDSQLIGALLPDLFLTEAITTTQLHTWDAIDEFDSILSESPEDREVIIGVRQHLRLDDRAHHSWNGDDGYAFVKQTDELRALVGQACSVDDETAIGLAHNFLETAVDIRLQESSLGIEAMNRVRKAIRSYDFGRVGSLLGEWTNQEVDLTITRTKAFYDYWLRHDTSNAESSAQLWTEMMETLNPALLGNHNALPVREAVAIKALEVAMDRCRRLRGGL